MDISVAEIPANIENIEFQTLIDFVVLAESFEGGKVFGDKQRRHFKMGKLLDLLEFRKEDSRLIFNLRSHV